MKSSRDFVLETLVDFPDDALSTTVPVTRAHIENLFDNLQALGVTRVIWAWYGDGRAPWIMPDIAGGLEQPGLTQDQNQWANYAQTLAQMSSPLAVAAEVAHARGMEVYAYFKPYETGPGAAIPNGFAFLHPEKSLPTTGGRLVWLDPFVAENPHLRLQRYAPPAVNDAGRTISSIRLTKSDDAPTRIKADAIRVWVSDDNASYRPLAQAFTFSDSVEPSPDDVFDIYDNRVTAKGAPVRVLTLSGLSIDAPFIAVTTTFTDGTPDFSNAWHRLVQPRDEAGQPIEGVYATGRAIWFAEAEQFPVGGLMFDTGRGPEVVAIDQPTSPLSNAKKQLANWAKRHHPALAKLDIDSQVDPARGGVIGWARGRCDRLSGALCETSAEVRAFWLSCIRTILDAGVDGIELRVENHSSHTDFPHEYGFNPEVLSQVEDKSQLADLESARKAVTPIRTEAYTQFVRDAHALTQARGKVLRTNLNLDWFRPRSERPGSRKIAYPDNINFDWQTWIAEGLVDAAMLRMFARPLDDVWAGEATAKAMIDACQQHGIPLTVNRYVWVNEGLADDLQRVREDGRFAGFVLYEVWSFAQITPEETWEFITDDLPQPPGSTEELWNLKRQTWKLVEKACRRD